MSRRSPRSRTASSSAASTPEQSTGVEEAAKQGIKLVSAGTPTPSPGPHDTLPIFSNITTDPLEGRRGVGVATPSPIPTARPAWSSSPTAPTRSRSKKSDAMAAADQGVRRLQGALEFEDTPLADVANAHAAADHLAAAALRRQAGRYCARHQRPDLRLHGAVARRRRHRRRRPAREHLRRRRQRGRLPAHPHGEYQVGDRAPSRCAMQGWQIVDELNRAFAGEKHSGYVAPVHLFADGQHRVRRRAEEHLRPGQRLSRRLPEDLEASAASRPIRRRRRCLPGPPHVSTSASRVRAATGARRTRWRPWTCRSPTTRTR